MHTATSETQALETITPAARPPRFQCRHIHTQGHRCGSPTLRGELFCYYHHTTRRPISRQAMLDRAIEGPDATFTLAMSEDRHALQSTLIELLQRIAEKRIDTKRAKLLLYGLQIASANLPKHKDTPTPNQPLVEEVLSDLHFGKLAPAKEIEEAPTPLNKDQPQKSYASIIASLRAVAEAPSTTTRAYRLTCN
ncbi:MAG: hypothetical protein JWM43_2178 [Acidobacteriaceae bacterium]|nr:hypothetical protein [Acidobacteriaceae bacterium]